MKKSPGPSLFGEEDEGPIGGVDARAPLAERLRPRSLDEFVGQEHLIGSDRVVRKLLDKREPIPSLILWGGPGTGKTTLARLLAFESKSHFIQISAVLAGVKEVREAIAEAKKQLQRGLNTILFIDEIHRFNKSQQDALLPAVEDGTITLIGATTENPSFEVNSALLSRCRVLTLEPLSEHDLGQIVERALADSERGLGALQVDLDEDSMHRLAQAAGGDARVALSALETAAQATQPSPQGNRSIAWTTLLESLGRARFGYDNKGEDHYNLISALIKSLRNSDVNAGLYWLARLIEGGADPMFIARRLCILASEDVGLADPQAMVQAAAAAQITHLIGLPEALFPLAQATIYLAKAPKSNAVKTGYQAAAADAAATAGEPVPLRLRNAVTGLMKSIGYGKGYRYAHDDPAAAAEMTCLPETLAGRKYLEPEAFEVKSQEHDHTST